MKIAIVLFILTFMTILYCTFIVAARADEQAEQIFAQFTRDGVTKTYTTAEECFACEECTEAYEEAHGVYDDVAGMARD